MKVVLVDTVLHDYKTQLGLPEESCGAAVVNLNKLFIDSGDAEVPFYDIRKLPSGDVCVRCLVRQGTDTEEETSGLVELSRVVSRDVIQGVQQAAVQASKYLEIDLFGLYVDNVYSLKKGKI